MKKKNPKKDMNYTKNARKFETNTHQSQMLSDNVAKIFIYTVNNGGQEQREERRKKEEEEEIAEWLGEEETVKTKKKKK